MLLGTGVAYRRCLRREPGAALTFLEEIPDYVCTIYVVLRERRHGYWVR